MNTKSIQFRLSLMVALVSLIILIITELLIVSMTEKIIDHTRVHLQTDLSHSLQLHIQSKEDVGLTNAVAIASNPALVAALETGQYELIQTELARISEQLKMQTNFRGVRLHVLDKELKTVARSWMKDGSGEDFSGRESLKRVITSGKPVQGFEPGPYGVWLRAMVPIQTASNQTIGVLSFMQGLGSVSREFEDVGELYAAVIDASLAPKEQKMGNWAFTNEKHYSDATRNFVQSIDLETLFQQKHLSTDTWEVSALPFLDSSQKQIGWHILGMPSSKIEHETEQIHELTFALLVLTILALLMLAFGCLMMVRKVVIKPTKIIADNMQKLAQGDFTVHFSSQSKDEIGQLSQATNIAITQTSQTFSQVRETTQTLFTSAQALNQQAEQLALTSEQSRNAVSQTSQTVSTLAQEIKQIANSAHHAQDKTHDTDKSVLTGHQIVTQTREDINKISECVQAASQKVGRLNESTDQVGSIVQTIKDIADQTNLLALNAAIEAARAGETGRGFAVVADEVRKLAEKTIVATDEINNMVQSIQNSTHSVVEEMSASLKQVEKGQTSAKQASQALDDIREAIATVNQEMEAIRAATESQSQATQNLEQTMSEMAAAIEHNAEVVHEAQNIAKTVNTQAEMLERPLKALRLP